MGRRVLVVGAGAAGLMAGCAAADCGAQVTVLEHNEKAGKKLYITGKGRCNYTNACETQDFFRNVLRNPKFLYSAVCGYDAAAMTAFLQDNGCPTMEERGRRCFPASGHASDVTDALVRHLRGRGGIIRTGCRATGILTEACGHGGMPCEADTPSAGKRGPENHPGRRKKDSPRLHATGVQTSDGRKRFADAVIIATGGISYPSTGSTGDGYRFAGELGLAVNRTQPSLVPVVTREDWPSLLQGLSLRNVTVRLEESSPSPRSRKPLYEGFGELLFTHFGLSGPLILSASCHTDFLQHPEGYLLRLDLKPAMTPEEVTARLHREFEAAPGKELRTVLRTLTPQRLAVILAGLFSGQCGWEDGAPVRSMDEGRVHRLAMLLKDVTLHLTGTRGFSEAIVTRGGVDVRQINPSTMETRSVRDLYWAGEVLDVDAYTGGFNLQIAWSTGHLAGISAAGM